MNNSNQLGKNKWIVQKTYDDKGYTYQKAIEEAILKTLKFNQRGLTFYENVVKSG